MVLLSMLYRIASRSILFFFLALMVLVTFLAFTRKSGITGIDIAEMHLLRSEKVK